MQKRNKVQSKTYFEEDISINGIQIHVGIWPGKKKPILCLHGLSGNLHSMATFANQLHKKGHKVISYDLRGRGHSSKPNHAYGFENHIKDLNMIIKHYQLKNFILLAHSFGCMIALRYTLLYPEQTKAMILMDGGGLLSVQKRIQILKVLKQSFERLDVIYRSKEEYINLVKNSPLVPKWTKKINDYFIKELHASQNGFICHMPKFVMEEELKEMGGSIQLWKVILNLLLHPKRTIKRMLYNRKPDFENIKIPTLVLRATQMNLFPNDDLLPKESFTEMIQRIPNSKGVEINTNHYGILFDNIKSRDKEIFNFIESQ
ncbi:Hydrolase or acyltransferase [Leptospira biflexa serovar Patoc strain 'Patoc 1 (Ames)']|uniref:Putative hydrolase, alpha/beta hydrolase superfamily n=1 Tax=Leptospira biflexa serovar Patoc (strain Patoc 1 / ATCC 23582 / Paris) TaxID=456481 RepID=B0SN92_LEPBP|nr:alpha/beta hydrolase [Leptospira biflexa]ABZ95179.1 Hydrolase or acyltransferase [Leptospira biflexa serovar Patoc strain 'Patoc 1 (Ames)']ABZ98859.1 Putative hydrolase, alpha/beta hydrolase superfamily [Leptospira biflexa serovar Patoc strain 'Patoc 1 (Paris)']